MSPVTTERTIRLSLDLNVLFADHLARRRGVWGTAASMLVDAVRDGCCTAGPVQLITSVPVIETWANVLRRHFGYTADAAGAKAWILQEYAESGPLGLHPQIVLGSRYVPFATEDQAREAARVHLRSENRAKLFDEIEDDRNVLISAIAGSADLLATSDIDDFCRGPAIRLQRTDVLLFPLVDRTLVIAKPSFIAFWLRQGIVPDARFVESHPDDFQIAG